MKQSTKELIRVIIFAGLSIFYLLLTIAQQNALNLIASVCYLFCVIIFIISYFTERLEEKFTVRQQK